MQECDLIMKGGITSGVVYPFALTEIAKDYRLRQIGGTSAGAIAAVFAAASEYERQASGIGSTKGFDKVAGLADELANTMVKLFQPVPPLRPLFDILMAAISGRSAFLATLWAFKWTIALTLLLIVGAVWIGSRSENWWITVAVVLIVIAFAGLRVALALKRAILRDLPKADFGICTGKQEEGFDHPGFSDWIAEKIDDIAGKTGSPLTIGDLQDHGIELAAMTTDLSTGRPYRLPLKTKIHYFSRSEFERLFDASFVKYLCDKGGKHTSAQTRMPKDDLYRLPTGRDFPVSLVARMSLSFPGLIAAVPLYRYDFQLGTKDDRVMRRCTFSDGGISSNFPIHFFDALLPRRPTFGISLGDFQDDRHDEADRVTIAEYASQSTDLPVTEITSLGGFAGSVVNTAKDWQDTMQSMMPGYADRIVIIRLKPETEGGLHLSMPPETIKTLTGLGERAGKMLVEKFSYKKGADGFDQHRYYRAISLLPKLENALSGFAEALDATPAGVADGMTALHAITDLEANKHKLPDYWRKDPLAAFANALAMVAKGGIAIEQEPGREPLSGRAGLPRFDASVRLIAEADRAPDTPEGSEPSMDKQD